MENISSVEYNLKHYNYPRFTNDKKLSKNCQKTLKVLNLTSQNLNLICSFELV